MPGKSSVSNSCKRCGRALRDAQAQYGWRCAEKMGLMMSEDRVHGLLYEELMHAIHEASDELAFMGIDWSNGDAERMFLQTILQSLNYGSGYIRAGTTEDLRKQIRKSLDSALADTMVRNRRIWEIILKTENHEDVFVPIPVEDVGGKRADSSMYAKPKDLVTIDGWLLDYRAAHALEAMRKAAYTDGIDSGLHKLISGFRTDEEQQVTFDKAINKARANKANDGLSNDQIISLVREYVALPGKSAHRTERAVDLYLGIRNTSGNAKSGAFDDLPVYLWLLDNAESYGFYPYSREAWHWEYNPVNTRSAN